MLITKEGTNFWRVGEKHAKTIPWQKYEYSRCWIALQNEMNPRGEEGFVIREGVGFYVNVVTRQTGWSWLGGEGALCKQCYCSVASAIIQSRQHPHYPIEHDQGAVGLRQTPRAYNILLWNEISVVKASLICWEARALQETRVSNWKLLDWKNLITQKEIYRWQAL